MNEAQYDLLIHAVCSIAEAVERIATAAEKASAAFVDATKIGGAFGPVRR